MLVRRLVDADGSVFVEYPPQPVRQVVSARAARLVTHALKSVVAQGGTAAKATLEHYTVAGKTGTAEKPDLVHGGYLEWENVHSFVGFFPADNPEVCLAVVIDAPPYNPYRYASSTAVPTFQRMAEQVARYLKIRPDRQIAPENPALASGAPDRLADAR
jgi:cell division protein FtsI/penicillin-binding protein 2